METRPLTVAREVKLGISEASAVGCLADGVFLVVDDERGVFAATLDGETHFLAHSKDLADIEGLCLPSSHDTAYVLSERGGRIFQYPITRDGQTITLGERHETGRLPQIGRRANRGWEGMAFAPGATWPDGDDRLIAVHQAKPRRIGVFTLPDLEPESELRLPREARRSLEELSDITISPRSGHWFVLSGPAGRIAEFERGGEPGAWTVTLLALYKIPTSKRDVPEGLTFDTDGRLWMVTDGKGRLIELTGLD